MDLRRIQGPQTGFCALGNGMRARKKCSLAVEMERYSVLAVQHLRLIFAGPAERWAAMERGATGARTSCSGQGWLWRAWNRMRDSESNRLERRERELGQGMAATSKSLVIVESPAKAKTIEKYLGKGFDVRASIGHIMDLPKNELGVELKKRTFEPELMVSPGKEKVVEQLKKLAAKADEDLSGA